MNRTQIKDKLVVLLPSMFETSGMNTDMAEFVDFCDDLDMDSISFITLVVEIEDCFNIIIPDDMLLMENFKNLESVIRVIMSQLRENEFKVGDGNDDKTWKILKYISENNIFYMDIIREYASLASSNSTMCSRMTGGGA